MSFRYKVQVKRGQVRQNLINLCFGTGAILAEKLHKIEKCTVYFSLEYEIVKKVVTWFNKSELEFG